MSELAVLRHSINNPVCCSLQIFTRSFTALSLLLCALCLSNLHLSSHAEFGFLDVSWESLNGLLDLPYMPGHLLVI